MESVPPINRVLKWPLIISPNSLPISKTTWLRPAPEAKMTGGYPGATGGYAGAAGSEGWWNFQVFLDESKAYRAVSQTEI